MDYKLVFGAGLALGGLLTAANRWVMKSAIESQRLERAEIYKRVEASSASKK